MSQYKDGEPFEIQVPTTVRWKKYKPSSSQFKGGKLGRWQEHNGYGWNNTEIDVDGLMYPERKDNE